MCVVMQEEKRAKLSQYVVKVEENAAPAPAATTVEASAPVEDGSKAAVTAGEGAGESAPEGSKKRGRAADFL